MLSKLPLQKFDLSTLGPCGSFPYGYVGARVKPCILIKLNKIWGWEPAPIEYKENPYSYDNLPRGLRNHLNSASAKEAEAAEENKNIWIDCAGRFVNNWIDLVRVPGTLLSSVFLLLQEFCRQRGSGGTNNLLSSLKGDTH